MADVVATETDSKPSVDGAKAEREVARSTFYTAINLESPIEPKKSKQSTQLAQRYHTLETTDAGPRIVEHHAGLKSLALTLDERMHALLREHEKDFFLAYKTHMYHVQGKMRELELKAEQEEAKTREDSKIKDLERELDWFKTEAFERSELFCLATCAFNSARANAHLWWLWCVRLRVVFGGGYVVPSMPCGGICGCVFMSVSVPADILDNLMVVLVTLAFGVYRQF